MGLGITSKTEERRGLTARAVRFYSPLEKLLDTATIASYTGQIIVIRMIGSWVKTPGQYRAGPPPSNLKGTVPEDERGCLVMGLN